jgi:hypothetical protein
MDGEPVNEKAASRLIKPTLFTRFHIDQEWWQRNEREWRVYLLSHLCPVHRAQFEAVEDDLTLDWVDPQTAEVRPIDGIQHALILHCSQQPEYITLHTSLVDAVFRVFLSNGNSALTVAEIAQRIQRPATIILKTLAGGRVYKGIRPVEE